MTGQEGVVFQQTITDRLADELVKASKTVE
jgi:hypothetical protein